MTFFDNLLQFSKKLLMVVGDILRAEVEVVCGNSKTMREIFQSAGTGNDKLKAFSFLFLKFAAIFKELFVEVGDILRVKAVCGNSKTI